MSDCKMAKSIPQSFSLIPEVCPKEWGISSICNCLSVPCLYIIALCCGQDAVILFLLKGNIKGNRLKQV